MKSIKLLAALAIPAMFAACTNEEIAVDSTQQLTQVVGAELIGTDISINVSNGIGSRLNADGWQTTDKLGMAWVVTTDYATPQDIKNAPTDNNWYANHMFAVEDGKFVTKGNAYKGWHFAYFPFSYTESVSEKIFNINPPQTAKEWQGGRINDALHISALKFLTRESLDENYQLKDDVVFEVQRAVNAIQVTTTAANEFAEGGLLADLKMKSIKMTVDAGQNVFANKVNMNVSKLPLDTAKVAITKDSLYKHLYVGTDRVLTRKDASNTITTDVANAGFVTSGTNKLITITVPESSGKLDSTNISIEVAVEGGIFKIAYDKDAEDGSNAAINNAAIIKLKKAYAAGGTMTKVGGLLSLNVVLYADIFETDFGHITDLDEWNSAVSMATKLGRTEQEFGVDSIIDFNGEIPMPEGCVVTVVEADALKSGVTAPALNIKKSIASWPAGLTSAIDVVNHKTISNATGINGKSITNYGNMKAVADTIVCQVVNEGTITLKALAKLSEVNNAKGRINVAYGSYVTLASGTDAGVIAYTVAASEKAYKINNLITTGYKEHANVNTLVVKSGRTFNLNLKDAAGAAGTDPYTPAPGKDAVELKSLEGINIELNEGILVADVNSGKNVKNVEIIGGENNEIKNVNIVEDLTVTKGKVTVDAEAVNDYKTAATIANVDVKKDAELISNVDIYVTNIANPSGAKTTVADPYTIWYTKVYTQGGTATGKILKASWDGEVDEPSVSTSGSAATYVIKTAAELMWLSENIATINTQKGIVVELDNDIDLSGVNWKAINAYNAENPMIFDGKNHTIYGLTSNNALFGDPNYSSNYTCLNIKNLIIQDFVIGSRGSYISALAGNFYGKIENVTVKDCKITALGELCIAYGALVGCHNSGTITNCNVERVSINGVYHSAGLIAGRSTWETDITYINCKVKDSDVSITCTTGAGAVQVGAIVGVLNKTLTLSNCTVENVSPTAKIGKGTFIE